MDSIWLAFFTGLTTGGLSCLTVQGGLLASAVSDKKGVSTKSLVGAFLISKLIAYTLLGFGLGLLGSALTISPTFQGWMQIFAGLYMLATAARLLNLHPIFRYTVIQPPKWAFRIAKNTTRDESLAAPAILGITTILIPCGITQAMMFVAIASGNPIQGALIMASFTLGTSPIFFALGVTAVKLLKKPAFALIAVFAIAGLGINSINSGQMLRGSFYTLQNFYKAATTDIYAANTGGTQAPIQNGKQLVNISVNPTSYSSSATVLKAGVPVKLSLTTDNVQGCTRAFVVPSLDLTKALPETGTEVVEFTPEKPGKLAYTCGMGMYGGTFTVVN